MKVLISGYYGFYNIGDNTIIPNIEHTISKTLFINLYIKFISLYDSLSDAVAKLAALLYISLLSTIYLLTL